MTKEHELNVKKGNDVEVTAIPKTTRSVSASFSGAVGDTSDSLDVVGGIAKVIATNTGSNVLRVQIVKKAFLSFVVKQWDVARNQTLNTGEFSITADTYRLKVGPVDGRVPTSGYGTLYSIQY